MSRIATQPVPASGGASRLAVCADVLDQLLLELQRCGQADQQVRLALHATRLLVQADFVFWHSSSPQSAIVDSLGDWQVSPAWRAELVRQMTASSPAATEICQSNVAAPSRPGPIQAGNVAMVRFSKSKAVWMVAVRCDPARRFGPEDLKLMGLVRRLVLQERQRVRTLEKLHSTLLGVVRCLTEAINANNPYTCDHSERVARIAVRLGQQMQLSPTIQSTLYLGGLLHDIGKVGIDSSVLQHNGPLTEEQRFQIQQHPEIGDRILSKVPSLEHLRPAVRNHHERFDGQGYPDGLQGEEIPHLARIMAVADACDAMFSARPYRPGMSTEMVDSILAEGAGSQWDPEVVRHFFACRTDLYTIYKKGLGDSVEQAIIDVMNV